MIGVKTLEAIAKRSMGALIRAFSDARSRFLRSLTSYKPFGAGWDSRVSRVLDKALAMTKGAAVAQSRVPLEDGAAVKPSNVPVR